MSNTVSIQLKEQAVLQAARSVVQRAQAGGPIETLLLVIDVLKQRLRDLDHEHARHAAHRRESEPL